MTSGRGFVKWWRVHFGVRLSSASFYLRRARDILLKSICYKKEAKNHGCTKFSIVCLKSVFLRTCILGKMQSSQNLQKLPRLFAGVRKGSFCNDYIFSNTQPLPASRVNFANFLEPWFLSSFLLKVTYKKNSINYNSNWINKNIPA